MQGRKELKIETHYCVSSILMILLHLLIFYQELKITFLEISFFVTGSDSGTLLEVDLLRGR